jgi:hypothetical protein
MKNYYQLAREERKVHDRKYYQEHREEKKEYYQEHREEKKAYQKKYRKEHKSDLKKYLKERKEEKPYKKQGDFLAEKLRELEKNQSWLARELGVTKEIISKYIQGIYSPRKIEKRKRLCRILKIKYSDLEKLVENQNVKS